MSKNLLDFLFFSVKTYKIKKINSYNFTNERMLLSNDKSDIV